MNKKNLLYILVAIVVLVVILIVFTKIDKKETENKENQIESASIEKNELTEEYIVYDNNGEIIANSIDKDSLEIYKIDPTYNPNP